MLIIFLIQSLLLSNNNLDKRHISLYNYSVMFSTFEYSCCAFQVISLTRLPLFSSVCFRLFISVLLSDSELNHKEFHGEVQILKRLRHRHLISLFAVCTATMPYYIITELMEKGSLLKFLRSKPQLCFQ